MSKSRAFSPLPSAFSVDPHFFVARDGRRLAYYVSGPPRGRPLVLLHSINAAPSSFEVQPLFEQLRAKRPVYSLDLPGFGHSQRAPAPSSPADFAAAIVDFLVQIVQQPADLLALSLSAEFAARAALEVPERVASLALISPTGFARRAPPPRALARVVHAVLRVPWWDRALFALLVSRRSIRYYLNQSFFGPPPEELIAYAAATAHQPDARHAPLAFLSGLLFTPGVRETLYARLVKTPVLVIADRDPYIDFVHLPAFLKAHTNWHWQPLAPHRGLPHWEKPGVTCAALEDFWRTHDCSTPGS